MNKFIYTPSSLSGWGLLSPKREDPTGLNPLEIPRGVGILMTLLLVRSKELLLLL